MNVGRAGEGRAKAGAFMEYFRINIVNSYYL
jgi:hypothetical protein